MAVNYSSPYYEEWEREPVVNYSRPYYEEWEREPVVKPVDWKKEYMDLSGKLEKLTIENTELRDKVTAMQAKLAVEQNRTGQGMSMPDELTIRLLEIQNDALVSVMNALKTEISGWRA